MSIMQNMYNPQTVNPYQMQNGEQMGQVTQQVGVNIIYLLEPNRQHRLGEYGHRPFLYQYGTDRGFVDKVAEYASIPGNHAGFMKEQLIKDAQGKLMPQGDPDTIINLNSLNDYWRFWMILDNPQSVSIMGSQTSAYSSLNKNRVLITGYFLDEPVNITTETPNTEAGMVITRKTIINVNAAMSHGGVLSTQTPETIYDAETVNGGIQQMVEGGQSMHVMDPATLLQAMDMPPEGQGQTNVTVGDGQTIGVNDIKEIDGKLTNPAYHMRKVIGQMKSAASSAIDSADMNDVYKQNILESDLNYQDYYTSAVSRTSPHKLIGPSGEEVLTFGQFLHDYNNPDPNTDIKFRIVRSEQISQFDIADPTVVSTRNSACALLAGSLPAILAQCGLTSLAFRADSFYSRGYEDEQIATQIFDGTSSIPLLPEGVRDRTQRAIREMTNTVFETVYQIGGDFILNASVDLGGLTTLTLNYKDQNGIQVEPYQHPTCYGGVVSSMVGTLNSSIHNASELAVMNDTVRGRIQDNIMSTNTPKYEPESGLINYQGQPDNMHHVSLDTDTQQTSNFKPDQKLSDIM